MTLYSESLRRVTLSTLHHPLKISSVVEGQYGNLTRGVQAGKKTRKNAHSAGFLPYYFTEPHRSLSSSSLFSLSLSLFSSSSLSSPSPVKPSLSLPLSGAVHLGSSLLILFSGRARSRSCSPLCLLFCFLFFFFLFNLPSSYHTTPPLGLL